MTNAAARRLRAIRLLHTAVWAVFAGSIVAIPVLAWQGRFGAAGVLAALVLGEVVVLWLNRWSCPLTAVAARYTDDRSPTFGVFSRTVSRQVSMTRASAGMVTLPAGSQRSHTAQRCDRQRVSEANLRLVQQDCLQASRAAPFCKSRYPNPADRIVVSVLAVADP